ncbi:MAG: Gfo/Idh/MocA family oxidoreductase [Hamadaea sp.]|uniref:Gfo/Idh/MocA family protein n=1 Tax=Hamadaea sp. TaxID=2024425 RepID=UPI0017920011|nr:Gfo/Idh/MocA family oxidoreductase [Hamadaea sp.]NUR73685.1 Gfo/Idh/MocA family oxidoreductase [Hamadaea sp.]NUT23766.1 Gfo/Idh/MocA family oxidoreductase [Hamadaea sp.]
MTDPKRYALVGTGSRAEMFERAIVRDHPTTASLVALCDTNPVRVQAHQRYLAELGAPAAVAYDAADFTEMLAKEQVDGVIVTTMDSTHADYITRALRAGCDVLTEKPMTTDLAGCEAILDTVRETGRNVTVTFNYRFNPVHEQVKRLLDEGAVGEIGSVHFEWLLDVRHGADYFRRWHREKKNSGGLLVHKSGHHFDLVNWWLSPPAPARAGSEDGGPAPLETARPVDVSAYGQLFFYGETGRRHGYARDYERAHGSPAATDDPFALHLAAHPRLRELYLDAESADGYQRDRNVFAGGIDIEDDLAVMVRYNTGATMTYHLTAYAPWEGYRLMVNGSRGRLELEVVENDHVSLGASGALKGAALHGDEAAAEQGRVRLTLHRFWEPPVEIDVPEKSREGHGGADAKMTGILFGGATDPLRRSATERDGALALLTGLAANRALATGAPVHVPDLLTL